MPGARKINDVSYCFVPTVKPASAAGTYWPNGPSLGAAVDRTAHKFLTPDGRGHYSDQHYALFEDELFVRPTATGHKRVWRFPGSEVWPVSWLAIHKAAGASNCPEEVVGSILQAIRLTYSDTQVAITINWGGIKVKHDYDLAPANLVAYIWPSKPVVDWGLYFIGLMTTSLQPDVTLPESGTLEVNARRLSGAPLTSRRTICKKKKRCLLLADGAPEFLEFEKDGEPAGLIPLLDASANFVIRSAPTRGNCEPSWPRLTECLKQSNTSCDLAIDFGTTNSAVAVRIGEGTPTLLSLAGCGCISLTRELSLESNEPVGPQATREAVGVDKTPGAGDLMGFFFPSQAVMRNPLPSLVFENPDFAEGTWEGLSLPRRTLALSSTPFLLSQAKGGKLIQDFKWRFNDEDLASKKAYLETLGLLAAWKLRNEGIREVRSIRITAPLAFTRTNANLTNEFFGFVESILKKTGIQGAMDRYFVSESYANVCYAAKGGAGSHAAFGSGDVVVVVDIGGGTCDMGVFQWVNPAGGGNGHAQEVFLDSLRIGGVDFVGSSPGTGGRLPVKGIVESWADKAALERLPWQDLRPFLFPLEGQPLSPESESRWLKLFGLAFTDLLGKAEARDNLAKVLGEMKLSNRFLTLLAFAVSYGALLAGGQKDVARVEVFLSGLGAGFLDLMPILELSGGKHSPRAQFQDAVKRVVNRVLRPRQIEVAFGLRPLGKEAVSCGALYVEPSNKQRFDRSSVFWSSLDGVWEWRTAYPIGSKHQGAANRYGEISVEPLATLVESCANEVGADTTMGEPRRSIEWAFRRACETGEYEHAVDSAVAGLKAFAATGSYQR